MITPGQIYYSAHPLDNIRIRIILSPEQFGGRVWAETVLADGRGVRQRSLNPRQFHDSPTTKSGQPRRTGYVLEPPSDRFAWCFSHGRQHRFAADQEPWCTASWVWLDGASETEALTTKAQVYGDAQFLHELPSYQQLAIINGDVPGQRTEELPR